MLAFCLRYPLATEALFGRAALDWGGDAIAGVYLANCYVIKVGMHLAGPKRVFIFTQLGSLPGSNYLSGVGLWRLRGFGHPGVLHPQNIDPLPREFGLSCWASQWLRPLDFQASSRYSDGPEATFPANVSHLSRTLAAPHLVNLDYTVVAYPY